MATPYSFGVDPITCHTWNGKRDQVALSLNNSEVEIYAKRGNDWAKLHTLSGHDLKVTSIDWAPKSNRIVTCGADRNAYVWTECQDKKWKPTLVLLRINRAATCVKWSPKENKFAVGSGARLISVCYFEQENDWWVSKHIKKPIRSTISAIDWHPNNILLAAGSTDFKTRVFSAYIKEIEEKPGATSWGSKMPLGNMMVEFVCADGSGGWVHSVSFSASGERLCWVSHDASISVVDASNNMLMSTVRTPFLPFLSCTWISDSSIVAVGHSCCPTVYVVNNSGQLVFAGKLDNEQKREATGLSAMQRFKTMDRTKSETTDTNLSTVHQNTITDVATYGGTKANTSQISTTAADGQLVIWDMKTLASQMNGLALK